MPASARGFGNGNAEIPPMNKDFLFATIKAAGGCPTTNLPSMNGAQGVGGGAER